MIHAGNRIRIVLTGSFVLALLIPPSILADDPFASAIRPTEPLTPEEELAALSVPPEFRIQLVASEPEIQKPINMAFDGNGRIWISCTQDYPFVDLTKPGDSIRVLEDTDADGKADKVTTFIDGITHPMGLLPYKDGVIAFSIPNIEFFRDTDGDGKCDKREFLYGPFDYSKDSHGLNNGFRRGYDGWVYACHGFHNHSVVKGRDGNEINISSGSIYRFRPDGSTIERYTFGQVNPFGMTFDQNGDLYSSDCHSKPLMLMIRDGQYPGFGRQHDGLGFVPEILKHSHGSTAIAGVTQANDPRVPAAFRNHFLIGNVMTSRVNQDSMITTGSSMQAVEEQDFVVSKDPWFRPVDLQMGPDGAIYIADFYNKIIGHYEVALNHPQRDRHRGRIWRVVPVTNEGVDASLTAVKDLSKCNLSELIDEANTSNVSRMICAINEISDRQGTGVVEELKRQLTTELPDNSRIAVLWSLHRLGELAFDDLQSASSNSSDLVRLHGQRIVADCSRWSDVERRIALAGLNDHNAFVRRAAGDALGRHPDLDHVRPLLDALSRTPAQDPVLRYQLTVALRNQLRIPGTLPTVLGQSLSDNDKKFLAIAAMGLDHHDAAAGLLMLCQSAEIGQIQPQEITQKIARWANPVEIDQLVKWLRNRWKDNVELQVKLLDAIRTGLRQQGNASSDILSQWAVDLVQSVLGQPVAVQADDGLRPFELAIQVIRSFQLRQFRDQLMVLSLDSRLALPVRSLSLDAAVSWEESPLLMGLAALFKSESLQLEQRNDLPQVIWNGDLDVAMKRLRELLKSLPTSEQLVVAQALLVNVKGQSLLLDLCDSNDITPRVLAKSSIRSQLERSQVSTVSERTREWLRKFPDGTTAVDQSIAVLNGIAKSRNGNFEKGRAVFENRCVTCHQLQGRGKVIGPQLDGIGNRGTERLLEDVLDPNRNVDEAFRSRTYALSDGRILSGIFRRQEGSLLIIADNKGEELSFPSSEVEQQSISHLSIMPDNWRELISEEEMLDLIAFLAEQKK